MTAHGRLTGQQLQVVADADLQRSVTNPSRCEPEPPELDRAQIDARLHLARHGKPNDPRDIVQRGPTCSRISPRGERLRPRRERHASACGSPDRVPRHRPIGVESEQHRAARTLLTEAQRLGIARIGVPAAESECGNGRPSRAQIQQRGSVRPRTARVAPCPIPGPEIAALRPVKEGNRDARSTDPETVQEAIGIRRSAMCGAPDREPVSQRTRLEPVAREDRDVRRPFDEAIEAGGAVPIVIARSQQHRTFERAESRAQQLAGIRAGRSPSYRSPAQHKRSTSSSAASSTMLLSDSRIPCRRARATEGSAQVKGASR